MFCYKCGEKLPDDSEFCYKCGTKAVKPAQNESDSVPTHSQTILPPSINASTQRSESMQPSQYQPIQWAHKTSSNVITKNKSKALIFTIIGVLIAAIVIAFICFGHFDFGNGNDADPFINFSGDSISNGHTDEKPAIFNILPEIPVTDESAFTYKYNSKLDGMVVTNYLSTNPEIRIPDTIDGYTVVGVDLSKYKEDIKGIIMPDTVKSFDFSYNIASGIKYINHPRDAGPVFFYMAYSSLECIYIPEGITDIAQVAFYGCKNLVSINLPDSITSIGDSAFTGCTSLTEITIPYGVTKIGDHTFENCTSLESVNLPETVTEIGYAAFSYCSNLTNITILGNLHLIGSEAFNQCSSLTSIDLHGDFTTIKHSTFFNCSNLTSITLPDSLTKIEICAFGGCESLTDIILPDSLTYISDCDEESHYDSMHIICFSAFNRCENISVTYKGKNYDYAHIFGLYQAVNKQ